MIVPKFWAESRVQQGIGRNQVTVRRYGWSDESQLNAQVNADARAREALQRILSGETLRRRERKVPYNGADGLPIREEILSTHGDAVITRNSYGAQCLNSPNVLFADVDVAAPRDRTWRGAFIAALIVAALALWLAPRFVACCETQDTKITLFVVVCVVAYCVFAPVFRKTQEAAAHKQRKLSGAPEEPALQRIRDFSTRHPDWGLRVYRTPAGFRVLASHATFAANQAEVAQCFEALSVDPVYVRMCLHQRCFRARITAKPWRMGSSSKERPPGGVWPVNPELLPARAAWATKYERAAASFAACRLIETLGSGVVHPDVRTVIELHDSLSRANSELPLA